MLDIERGQIMGMSPWKSLFRTVIVGVVWAAVLIGIGLWIDHSTSSPFVDILFFEGCIFIIFGGLSLMGGIPLGVSLKGIGQKTPLYTADMLLEIVKSEDEINKKTKVNNGINETKGNKLNYAFNAISLLLAGGICIIIDIILVVGIQ